MAENLSIVKLNNDNYDMWKFKIHMLLMKDDLWTVICDDPPTSNSDLVVWNRKDSKARAIIGLPVDDSQVNLIKNAKSAKEAWNALKEYHEKATLTTEVMILKQLCQLKYTEDRNMEHHLNEVDI